MDEDTMDEQVLEDLRRACEGNEEPLAQRIRRRRLAWVVGEPAPAPPDAVSLRIGDQVRSVLTKDVVAIEQRHGTYCVAVDLDAWVEVATIARVRAGAQTPPQAARAARRDGSDGDGAGRDCMAEASDAYWSSLDAEETKGDKKVAERAFNDALIECQGYWQPDVPPWVYPTPPPAPPPGWIRELLDRYSDVTHWYQGGRSW